MPFWIAKCPQYDRWHMMFPSSKLSCAKSHQVIMILMGCQLWSYCCGIICLRASHFVDTAPTRGCFLLLNALSGPDMRYFSETHKAKQVLCPNRPLLSLEARYFIKISCTCNQFLENKNAAIHQVEGPLGSSCAYPRLSRDKLA
jgi:hypothetical protein